MIKTLPSCQDIFEQGLLPMEQALAHILTAVNEIKGLQRIPIEQAKGRILAHDIVSSVAVPAFTNSAVDGYALNAEDLPGKGNTANLDIAGIAYAGKPFKGNLAPGQCIRIMTGAAMPKASDTVVMQEQCERWDKSIRIDDTHQPGQNVRQAGEDMQEGQTVLSQGRMLTPADIGLLAALGCSEISVRRKLKIVIASTGDEIINVGTIISAGGIYDSNRYTLYSALQRPAMEITSLGILEDTPEGLLKKFNEAAAYADVIISSGGVSVGEADYTKTALQQSGSINFWKVAIKPGRPLAFGHIANCAFFGLPGNPVAVMVTLYLFVFPALENMLGLKDKPIAPLLKARCLENIRKKPGRTEIPRGIIKQTENGDWTVKTTGKQGSGILRSMSLANAFILLSHDSGSVKSGDWVTVQPFAGLF